jgi:hypothetical protein
MSKSNGLTAELLEEIVAAFNRRDIEAITGYFAEDGYWKYVDRQKAPADYL